MTTPPPQELIDFAGALADAARPVIRRHFRTPVAVDIKPDASPVTIADRDAETAMRALIEARYPEHGIIGEEHGAMRADAEWCWVLDPIDGTKAFIAGKPIFSTLIALVEGGEPVLGIIDQPVLGERWLGSAGQPTLFNGKPVHTRPCTELSQAILNATTPDMFTGQDATAFQALGARAAMTQYGGDGYAYGLLASGFIDLVAEADLKPYDFAALLPVITGAGGAVSDWQGQPMRL
ncbi:MAG: histidinol-phosphatase, partial [Alphaproteobacteria bacterium]